MSDAYDSYVLPYSSPAELDKPASTPIAPTEAEVSKAPPVGLQKLPNLWKYLTRDAKPADPDSAGVDAFGNPRQPTNRCEPSETEEEPRAAIIGEAPPFDPAEVLQFAPPDLEISHQDEPIIQSFAEHMSQNDDMTVSKIHAALGWANTFEGNDADMLGEFVHDMAPHGWTRAQAQQAKLWFDGYGGEAVKGDAAVADCE